MSDKDLNVRLSLDGAGKIRADMKSVGDEAQKSFAQIDQGARLSGAGLQNAGYQVQDFAVQLASGTDVSRAFAQQLPQLLSGFGLFGVAAGTASAILIPLAGDLFDFGEGAVDAADKVKTLSDRIGDLERVNKNFSVEGIQGLIDKYGEADAKVLLLIERQRQLAQERAFDAAKVAAGSFNEQVAELRANLEAYDNFAKAAASDPQWGPDAQSWREAVEAMGFTVDEARQLLSTMESLRSADTIPEMADAASALYGLLEGTVYESSEFAQTLLDAEDSLRQLNAEGGGIGGWLGAAIGWAADLGGNLWEAARAAAAIRGAQAAAPAGRGDPRDFVKDQYWKDKYFPDPERMRPAGRVGGGGGGGGGGVSQAEREAARIFDQTRTAAEKYAIELKNLNELHKSGNLDTETYNRAVAKLGEDLSKTGDLGKKAADAIRGAFDNLFDDPAAALKDLAQQLFQMALYQQLATSFPAAFGANGVVPLLNANGNVFEGGEVMAFAGGGIVSGATMFPMRGGMGVMGEAGPEAIMPLTRIGGKLGVAAAGGGGSPVKVEINNFSGEQVAKTEARGPRGEQIIRVAVGSDLASGKHDSVLRSRFGVPPNKMKR